MHITNGRRIREVSLNRNLDIVQDRELERSPDIVGGSLLEENGGVCTDVDYVNKHDPPVKPSISTRHRRMAAK